MSGRQAAIDAVAQALRDAALLDNAGYIDGHCRCVVCPRCHHHTGNSHQGHYWAYCLVKRGSRDFHFCCPDPAFGCELEHAS